MTNKVKQKLEQQLKKIIDKFPELVKNQMHLGVGGHPNIEAWKQTASKVSTDTLNKYRTLRFILNVWNSEDDLNNSKNQKLDYIFKENKMYNLAKLFREEVKQQTKN
jgi:hypothetical protein